MRRVVFRAAAAGIAVMLADCQSFREATGAAKLAPDEFVVMTKSPLIIPPDFNLRPPIPGAPDRGQGSPADMARTALFGQNPQAAAAALPGNFSEAERNLLARSGGSLAEPTIRQAISADSGLTDQGTGFAQRIINPAAAASAPQAAQPVAAQQATAPTVAALPAVAPQQAAAPAVAALLSAVPQQTPPPAPAQPTPMPVAATRVSAPIVAAPAPAAQAPGPVVALNTPPPVQTAPRNPVLTSGSAVLQLGAYVSEAGAQDAWQSLRVRHAAIIGGLSSDVQVAEIPDRGTLYRLRVGPFADRAAAAAACEALRAEGGDCLVAQP